MKKAMAGLASILTVSLIYVSANANAQMGGGGMGSGMGMGQGMTAPGNGYGPSRQNSRHQQQPQQPIDSAQAKSMAESYIQSTGNPALRVGDIKDAGWYYEADILTGPNSFAYKLLIDKNTGEMRSDY
jgi:membrane protease subunit (stomatin/prohibitin family)